MSTLHEYGFRSVVDVAPGVDWLWAPDLEAFGAAPHQQRFVKVLGNEATSSTLAYRRLLLECPSGRTYERTFPYYRHVRTFYASHDNQADGWQPELPAELVPRPTGTLPI